MLLAWYFEAPQNIFVWVGHLVTPCKQGGHLHLNILDLHANFEFLQMLCTRRCVYVLSITCWMLNANKIYTTMQSTTIHHHISHAENLSASNH